MTLALRQRQRLWDMQVLQKLRVLLLKLPAMLAHLGSSKAMLRYFFWHSHGSLPLKSVSFDMPAMCSSPGQRQGVTPS